jgi:hypothetical protein
MTVRIPVVTVFDSKGLRQAQHQLNKVRGNFRALGRNFAVAGAAIGAVTAALGKSVQAAAEQQKVYAQTEAVLKSTGTTANGTADDIRKLAESLQNQTAFADDAIQSGANLLLTFKNIQNQAGANNDIFDQTVAATLDVARAMGTSATGEAIRLGKALNDPVKGISALTRVGITFTDAQKEQIKALTESGDLMSAQKIILAELQSQFGGSAAAFAKTFAGQVESLNNELGDMGEEIGFIVMPAVQSLVTELRELIPVIGPQIKEALGSVDWASFTKSLFDAISFLIQNAEAIMKVVTALFVLNTTYHAAKIAVGLYNAAAVILGNTFVVTAGKIGLATGAVKLFRTALITTGIGALVVGLGFIIEAIINTNKAAEEGKPAVDNYGGAIRKSGADAEWAAGKYGIATKAVKDYSDAVSRMPRPTFSSAAEDRRFESFRPGALPSIPGIVPPALTGGAGGGGGGAGSVSAGVTGLAAWTANAKKEAKVTAKEVQLISKGLSADVARSLVGTNTPIKTANQAIQRINKNGAKAIANLTRNFQNSAAGQQAAAAQAAAAAEQAAQAAAAAAQAAAEQARREAEILAEKQRVYEAFAFSVTSTFGRIKDSILGAFSLPELGGSTNSIIRNMDKLLVRVRAFSQNITRLSDMGLDPKLLQQVINAGPIAGAKLAANLVSGGVAGLNTINRGFSELGGLATDIGTTGTQAAFRGEAQQNIYNLTINGGLDSGASIGKAVVDAIKAYERTSGVVFQGA